ncbi:MAG TPA: HAMP domain-containing sensor histidine kinase [Solirubrobacterales bacterium]|jgi:signal transduction histidine kinase
MSGPEVITVFAAAAPAGLATAWAAARERRRRRVLNGLLHELRRPLQALALAAPRRPDRGPDPLELALAALRDLDRAINGAPPPVERRPVEARMLAVAAASRWRGPAARAGRRVEVRWTCGDARVSVDPVRIAQALDNLIANALEHGRGTVTVAGSRRHGRLELTVRDEGGRGAAPKPTRRDPRRGHGLGLARAWSECHGGAFNLRRGAHETVATIELPLVDPDRPRRRRALAPGRPVRA